MNKNKTSTTIAMILMTAMAISIVAIPATNAQENPIKQTHAYVGATPNPIGVGQETLIHVGITDALALAGMTWEGLSIIITKPDGTTQTIRDITTDSTGGTGRVIVPDQSGNWTLQTHFPEQQTTATNRGRGVPVGTVMLESTSEPLTLVVQEDPIPHHPGHPLPSEYWTRPIDAQLREWHAIAGNSVVSPSRVAPFVPYNEDAPETAHILWTKPITMGGLAGGLLPDAQAFDCGDAYEGFFGNPVIIGGVLYYNQYKSDGGTRVEQNVIAVDLHTGEELWVRELIGPDEVPRRLSFGQVFYWSSYNYHAVFPYLWTTVGSTWNAFDPFTGRWVYSMSDVPSGTNIYGPKGEIYRYTVNLANGWMTLWNSSRVVSTEGSWIRGQMGTTIDATRGIEWNKTIPTGLPGSVNQVFFEDRIIGSNVTASVGVGHLPVELWGINLKPGQEGLLLFKETWQPPPGNLTLRISRGTWDVTSGVFVIWSHEETAYYGFSMDTGQKLWGPSEPQHYLDFFREYDAIINDKLYSTGEGGIVYCYNVQTGELLWTYEAYDPLNEILWSHNWNIRPAFFADGKMYLIHSEHSPIDPKPRGAPFICLDMETGEEIWRIDGAFRGTWWGGEATIGDSIIATMCTYDQRVYAIGKGPSAISVEASPHVLVHGSNVLVKGMVTDISPGTDDFALQKRFPHGVPAVADESMSDWMLYVYKQFERPADAVGVEVVVSVLDPNNNYYEVGRTVADSNGFFRIMFEPEVPGEYTVIAEFEGSKAYYGSFAQTAIGVEEAPAIAEPTPPPESIADVYLLPGIIGIIIAIVVVGAVIVLMLRKR